ncbi:MAG: lysylphosphatidylglycerol synthase transmembrane domain-containing protein [Ginsengibacter sp.]
MRKKILSILKYLVFLGIGLYLVWWQVGKMTDIQKTEFIDSLKNMHYWYLVPVILMGVVSHISRAIRWNILIEPMGYKPSTANSFYSLFCGYFANLFVPRAGEILRCTLLSRYEKIPFSKLVGTVIVERIVDLFSYFLIILITFLIQITTVTDFIKEKIGAISGGEKSMPLWIKLSIVAGVILLMLVAAKLLFSKFKGHAFTDKIKKIIHGLTEGFLTIMKLKRKKAFIAHSIFIWTLYLLQVYVGFSALSQTSHLGIEVAFSVLSLSTLAMIISPGGIGAFPVAVQQVLLIYNVDNISFGWLVWGVNTVIILVLGILCFGILIHSNKIKTGKFPKYETVDLPVKNEEE